MAFKPKSGDVARMAAKIATGAPIPYESLKCDAFVEKSINDCGAIPSVNWAGTNDMVRNAMDFVRPLSGNYMDELKPGDLLFIKADNEADLPAKYRGDGIGDFNHVGIYVGDENAFKDVDKNGKERLCNVAHSSSTMGRVAGSRLEKKIVSGGWRYWAQATCIDHSSVDRSTAPTPDPVEVATDDPTPVTATPQTPVAPSTGEAMVNTKDTGLLLRKTPDEKKGNVIKEMPKGAIVKVLGQWGFWTRVLFVNHDGMPHEGYCKTEYLLFG